MPGPLPEPSPVDQPYWDAAREHRLLLQECERCSHLLYPPASLCPACNSTALRWREMSGKGRVWSWVVMHRRYFPDMPPPYTVVRVRLEEGPFIMANLVESDSGKLAMEAEVEVVYQHLPDGFVLPQFRLIAKGSLES